MKIAIFSNDRVPREAAERLRARLIAGGAAAECVCSLEALSGYDRIAVLGGDGTVLRVAKAVHAPIVGINYGRLGFLTEFEKEEDAAALLLDETCPTVARTMLSVRIAGKEHLCLNELALLRRIAPEHPNRVEKISVSIDGCPAGDYAADGLIVATPTGSTAYSLSAGGSIVTPDCAVFLLTPVCAFSLKSRPLIYSDRSVLGFTLAEKDELMVYGDGAFFTELKAGDEITVSKAEQSAVFLTRDTRNFFPHLMQKLS